jgi:hypothetical protein
LKQRAFVYLKTLNPESVISDCNKVLRIEKNSGRALLIRGGSKIMLGKNNSGCKDIEKAILLEEPDALQIFDEVCY